MEQSTIRILGKGLKQSFRPPEDLPYPMRKALEALADKHDEALDDNSAESQQKARCRR